jgi:hypothetical protein
MQKTQRKRMVRNTFFFFLTWMIPRFSFSINDPIQSGDWESPAGPPLFCGEGGDECRGNITSVPLAIVSYSFFLFFYICIRVWHYTVYHQQKQVLQTQPPTAPYIMYSTHDKLSILYDDAFPCSIRRSFHLKNIFAFIFHFLPLFISLFFLFTTLTVRVVRCVQAEPSKNHGQLFYIVKHILFFVCFLKGAGPLKLKRIIACDKEKNEQ